jgi:hypothetical protein
MTHDCSATMMGYVVVDVQAPNVSAFAGLSEVTNASIESSSTRERVTETLRIRLRRNEAMKEEIEHRTIYACASFSPTVPVKPSNTSAAGASSRM